MKAFIVDIVIGFIWYAVCVGAVAFVAVYLYYEAEARTGPSLFTFALGCFVIAVGGAGILITAVDIIRGAYEWS